jgi:hypothetical protein
MDLVESSLLSPLCLRVSAQLPVTDEQAAGEPYSGGKKVLLAEV